MLRRPTAGGDTTTGADCFASLSPLEVINAWARFFLIFILMPSGLCSMTAGADGFDMIGSCVAGGGGSGGEGGDVDGSGSSERTANNSDEVRDPVGTVAGPSCGGDCDDGDLITSSLSVLIRRDVPWKTTKTIFGLNCHKIRQNSNNTRAMIKLMTNEKCDARLTFSFYDGGQLSNCLLLSASVFKKN